MQNTITDAYDAASQFVVELVGTISPDRWDDTGLGVWSIRSLVGHTARSFSLVADYVRPEGTATLAEAGNYLNAAVASLADPAAVAARGVAAGEALGPDPAAAVAAQATRARAIIADAGPSAVAETPVGTLALANYLRTRVVELVVHGIDIARALGQAEPAVPGQALCLTLHQLADNAHSAGTAISVVNALSGRASLPEGYRALP